MTHANKPYLREIKKSGTFVGSQKGIMPKYHDPKPVCFHCKVGTWVVAAGRTNNWDWYCTKCTREFKNES